MNSRQSKPEESTSSTAARVLRAGLIALVPTLVAFAVDKAFASIGAPWLLMIAAVIVSAANGGMASGLVATVLSAALVWWTFIPPIHTLGAADPLYYISVATFVIIGFAISLLHERLRLTTDRFAHAARQNRIFAALIENSTDFIGIADPEGNPVYLNPAGRRMVELPDEVPIERTRISEYYPPDVRGFARDVILRDMFARGTWAGETSFRNWRTGAPIPVLDTHFLVRDPATGQVIAMATITRDISAQKAQRDELEKANQRLATAMRELAESQRFLQGILDYSPNGIVIKSLDGRYLVLNKGFGEITRTTVSDALRKTAFDLFPRELAERLTANDRAVLATRSAVVSEETLGSGRDRRVLLINKFPLLDDSKEPFAIGSISTDITQRKRAEEALGQSARDLRTAQRVAHVGSWHWDTRTGEVQWSEELYRIFGLDPRQPRPPTVHPSRELLTPESFIRASEAVEKTRGTGEPYEAELEIVRPDGAHRWISARGEAVCDAKGTVIGLDGIAADITHVKELQRLRDEWTSVIAHDLRQPIGTILMASDFLPTLHAGKVNEKEQAFVQRIHSAAQSLRRMVDDLLDMSLLEAQRLKLEQTPTDPRDIVAGTVEELAHVPGIERVKVSATANVSPVSIDKMRMGQVLANLVSNAIKYGDEDSDITIGIEQRGGEVEIAVTNRGPGIAPDELPRLFNRFMRSQSTRGSGVPGLGLGLYISRGIVEAHGGRLWAESTPGATTTFHIALPVSIAVRQAA